MNPSLWGPSSRPVLYTASFYAPQDWVGRPYRVSRGHPRGQRTQWETLPFLYPRRDLILSYRAGEVEFAAFAGEYRQGLDQGHQGLAEFQEWLRAVPSLGDFTLLCFELAGKPCHRQTLARWLLERVPSLQLGALR